MWDLFLYVVNKIDVSRRLMQFVLFLYYKFVYEENPAAFEVVFPYVKEN
jgi:hypothetical protein